MLEKLWNDTMKKELNSAQSTFETYQKSEQPALFDSGKHFFHMEKKDLQTHVKEKDFHHLFRLPVEEKLFHGSI